MQPQPGPPRPRPVSTAGIADPETRRVIEAQRLKIEALEAKLAALQAAPPWPPLSLKVLTALASSPGRSKIMQRTITFRSGQPPLLGASESAGEIQATGGGGGGRTVQNITNTIVNENVGTLTPHGHQGLSDGGFLGGFSGGL